MKKFFTTVPLQQNSAELSRLIYQPVDNTRLRMDDSTIFPILAAVNGYAKPGENFRLIAVTAEGEAACRNRDLLAEELAQLCTRRGLTCTQGVETVTAQGDQTVAAHARTFQKLLDYVDDDDELFSCMTFGTKPLSHAIMLALQYAYRVKRNASISCVVYGEVDRTGPRPWDTGRIYDMTALVRLDEIVHMLARQGVADPRGALDAILSL